jgi:heme exporter protein D
MIDLGPYALFILWAYGGVAATLIVLIGYVLWDSRRAARRLEALEARGIRRRSGGPAT